LIYPTREVQVHPRQVFEKEENGKSKGTRNGQEGRLSNVEDKTDRFRVAAEGLGQVKRERSLAKPNFTTA